MPDHDHDPPPRITLKCARCGAVLTRGLGRSEVLVLCLSCWRVMFHRLGDWPTGRDVDRRDDP